MTGMTPAEPLPRRRREKFAETQMPNEPASDRKLVLGDGQALRERMTNVTNPNGLYMRWTLVRLAADGSVVLNGEGGPDLAPAHEHFINGGAAAVMTDAELDEVILREREIAAAAARDHFAGMDRLRSKLGRI